MNKSKTKVMFNNLKLPADIKIDGQTLEHVNNYVYLGQLFSINTDSEIKIKRRISYAWSKFGKLSRYLQDQRYPLALKKKNFPTMCSASIHVWFRNMDSNEKMAKKLNAAHLATIQKPN